MLLFFFVFQNKEPFLWMTHFFSHRQYNAVDTKILYFLLVEVEDYHILLLILLWFLENLAVLSHELILNAFKLFIKHDVLKRTHHLIEVNVIRRCCVVCIIQVITLGVDLEVISHFIIIQFLIHFQFKFHIEEWQTAFK